MKIVLFFLLIPVVVFGLVILAGIAHGVWRGFTRPWRYK